MYSDQAHIDELARIWATNISDPPPGRNIFENLLTRYGYKIMTNAVNSTVRRYNRGGIDYDGCVRYCTAIARSAQEKEALALPAEWYQQCP